MACVSVTSGGGDSAVDSGAIERLRSTSDSEADAFESLYISVYQCSFIVALGCRGIYISSLEPPKI